MAMATPRRIHFDREERGGFLPEDFAAAWVPFALLADLAT